MSQQLDTDLGYESKDMPIPTQTLNRRSVVEFKAAPSPRDRLPVAILIEKQRCCPLLRPQPGFDAIEPLPIVKQGVTTQAKR